MMNWFELTSILTRPIAFHRIFATIGGGACAGLFLSQAFYWSSRTQDPNGWFYKTHDEWEEETALTRKQQQTVRQKLLEAGLLEEKLEGMPAKLYFRLNQQGILDAISGVIEGKTAQTLAQQQMGRSDIQDGQIGHTRWADRTYKMGRSDKHTYIQRLHTEITPETTAETAAPLLLLREEIPSVEIVLAEEEEKKPETPLSQTSTSLASVPKVQEDSEDKSCAAEANVKFLEEIEKIAYDWRKRPWMASATHYKPEMVNAVWRCSPVIYSIPGTQTPNPRHIVNAIRARDQQLQSLDEQAINAYHQLNQWWTAAKALANPQIQHAFVAAANQSKEQVEEMERQRRIQERVERLKNL